MTATAGQTVERAASQIGTAEARDGGTPYHDWFGAPHAWAWCAIFQSWLLYEGAVPLGPSPKGTAWASGLRDWFAASTTPGELVPLTAAQPGDLCFFEWGTTAGGYDHVGLIERVESTHFVTIEGNVGNAVRRQVRDRRAGGILELARPAYATTAPPPPPTQEADVAELEQEVWTDPRPPGPAYLVTTNVNPDGTRVRLPDAVWLNPAALEWYTVDPKGPKLAKRDANPVELASIAPRRSAAAGPPS